MHYYLIHHHLNKNAASTFAAYIEQQAPGLSGQLLDIDFADRKELENEITLKKVWVIFFLSTPLVTHQAFPPLVDHITITSWCFQIQPIVAVYASPKSEFHTDLPLGIRAHNIGFYRDDNESSTRLKCYKLLHFHGYGRSLLYTRRCTVLPNALL